MATTDRAEGPAGIPRRRKDTRRSVIIVDRIADWTVTVGGLLVIIAVFGIMAFLAQVVVPLFTGGHVESRVSYVLPIHDGGTLMVSTDEYRTVGLKLGRSGAVLPFHLPSGRALSPLSLDLAGGTVTAFGRTPRREDVVLGFADGTLRFGKVRTTAEVLPADRVPAGLARIDDRDRTDGTSVYAQVPGNQVRKVTPEATLDAPIRIADDAGAIVALDYRIGGTVERPTRSFVAVDDKGTVRIGTAESRMNMMTRQVRTTTRTATLPALPAGTRVETVLMTEKADQVYVGDARGMIHRYDVRDFASPMLAESVDLLRGEALTSLYFLNGEASLVVGGGKGTTAVYFRLQQANARSTDGFTLVRAHTLAPHPAAVTAIGASQRTKMFVTGDAAGGVLVRHSTSERTLLRLASEGGRPIVAALLTPRDDGVLAVDADGRAVFWHIEVPHPETTLGTIFGKVWYEGYSGPTYTWQSSSGTDSFEPKLSLVPLIFGTIKATLYSLLFAVPVAMLAAIYTSEFVHHRVRAVVKPTMEMMASLPSVVLGFIAALILAPLVETWIAAVLLAFFAVPLSLFAGAHLWQLLPGDTARRLGGLPKLAAMFVVLGLGLILSWWLGAAFEAAFFGGSFKAWVNRDLGTGTPFLFLMLLPVSFLAVLAVANRTVGRNLADAVRALPPGVVDLLRWLATLAAAAALAFVAAELLTTLGFDPRGAVVDTYVQRNTLVVGFAMGFAVIPIVYTIAEDALSAVPEHLRAASLACGATPWQTAVAVILPTAASGVFAAVMVGMGRAVGETMIVVMAAGNTAILDWNVFNGLRALSANIAVELPEAVKDETLYRMLFLAALTLFVMTFVINTVAEVIRQRFRRRAVQL
ncbi:MAG: ABC transporter permease subunit [Alphaproteobacteria bacterium]|nr:ABC transporter permease subunit [Alphaproteobacteria bacterium]